MRLRDDGWICLCPLAFRLMCTCVHGLRFCETLQAFIAFLGNTASTKISQLSAAGACTLLRSTAVENYSFYLRSASLRASLFAPLRRKEGVRFFYTRYLRSSMGAITRAHSRSTLRLVRGGQAVPGYFHAPPSASASGQALKGRSSTLSVYPKFTLT